MSFKIMADNGVSVSAKQDGALYNVALGNRNFIFKNIGNEFALSNVGLVVSVDTGEAVVHGRHITAEEVNTITLPSNESGYLVLRVDLTQAIGEEAYLYATPTLSSEEINWGGTINDLVLAEFTTGSIDITTLTDAREIIEKVGATKTSELTNDSGFLTKITENTEFNISGVTFKIVSA